MRRLLYLLPALVFAVVAGYFLAQLWVGPAPGVVPSALIDKPAPPIDLPPLYDGDPRLTSADLADGPVLVNFFASWCVPCRVEHPLLMRLAKEEGVKLFGVSYKDEPAKSRALLEDLGNPYAKVGVDRSGRTAIEFGLYGVPETYVIDRKGRIRFRQPGPLDPATVEERILPLLKELSG
ncbi:MAG: DsbE family thiol:disulfide interchange protein [Rhodospirillaceae bacterium]|nr:DsbE family thiol:disulfide interchange protein [Rhodospirillaceae bacterium]